VPCRSPCYGRTVHGRPPCHAMPFIRPGYAMPFIRPGHAVVAGLGMVLDGGVILEGLSLDNRLSRFLSVSLILNAVVGWFSTGFSRLARRGYKNRRPSRGGVSAAVCV